MNSKQIAVLLGLLVLLAVGFSLTQMQSPTQMSPTSSQPMDRLFPELEAQANQVDKLEIRSADEAFFLENKDGLWRMPERDDYPADFNQVQRLVLGLASLKPVEAKTRKADRYSRLQLEAISEPNAKSLQVVLYAGDTQLAGLLIGKTARSGGQSDVSRYYVRKVGDEQSWLAEGKLVIERSYSDWLDSRLFPETIEIKSIKITHADGEQLSLIQDDNNSSQYNLADIGDAKLRSQYSLNQVASLLAGLELQDVTKTLDDKKDMGSVVMTLSDETAVTINTVQAQDRYWFQLQLPAGLDDAAWQAYSSRYPNRWFAVLESTYQSVFKRRSDWIEEPETEAETELGAETDEGGDTSARPIDQQNGILSPLDFGVPGAEPETN